MTEHKASTSHSQSPRRAEMRSFLEKVVIDAGVGRLGQQPGFEEKILPQVTRDLAAVTGQHPQLRRAKESIAGFKLREGQIVGLRITLRGEKMVDFFERLITIVLPRVRDFGGLEHSAVDQGGTLNVGLRDHFVFPEISPEESPVSFSLGMSIVPKKKARETAFETYKKLGVPMKREASASRKKGSKKRK